MNIPTIRRKLPNGLTLLYRHTPRSLLSELQFFVPGGQIREPQSLGGLSNLTMELAVKGTRRLSHAELADRIEALGGSLWGDEGQDHAALGLSVPSDRLSEALPLFSETVNEASFPEEELDKERKAVLAEIKSRGEHPFTVAYDKLKELLYGDHPYARPVIGTRPTVSRISREDVVRWKETWVAPRRAVLSVASCRPPEKLMPLLKDRFGRLPGSRGPSPAPARRTAPPRLERRATLHRRFKQATLLVGFWAPSFSSPLYPSVKILNAVLGGGMSARLFRKIREERGLSYEVGSFYPTHILGSALVIHMGLRNGKVREALTCVRDVLEDIEGSGPTPEELADAKRYLRGLYFMDHQTNARKAFYAGWWEILGLGAGFDTDYPKLIESVTIRQVRDAARRLFETPAQIVELHPD